MVLFVEIDFPTCVICNQAFPENAAENCGKCPLCFLVFSFCKTTFWWACQKAGSSSAAVITIINARRKMLAFEVNLNCQVTIIGVFRNFPHWGKLQLPTDPNLSENHRRLFMKTTSNPEQIRSAADDTSVAIYRDGGCGW